MLVPVAVTTDITPFPGPLVRTFVDIGSTGQACEATSVGAATESPTQAYTVFKPSLSIMTHEASTLAKEVNCAVALVTEASI